MIPQWSNDVMTYLEEIVSTVIFDSVSGMMAAHMIAQSPIAVAVQRSSPALDRERVRVDCAAAFGGIGGWKRSIDAVSMGRLGCSRGRL